MTRNPKIPHYIRDMDFSLRKISHPAHAGIRNDRKEGRNDKKWRLFKALDYEKWVAHMDHLGGGSPKSIA